MLSWDDDINILTNAHLRGLTWENVRWMFTDASYMRRYVPLTWLDWAIDYELFGLTAQSAHVGNIVLHAVNAALVFLLVRRLLRMWRPERPFDERSIRWASAAGALVWAVHPLRVEVVAWASGRIYCQAALFWLLATLAYLRAAEAERTGGRVRLWLGGSVLAFTASLLTYPIGASYVAVLLVLDAVVLRRLRARTALWRDPASRRALLEKVPFVLVTLLVTAITVLARFRTSDFWPAPPTLAEFSIAERAMQGFYLWAYYVWRPFAPSDLAPVYTTLVWFDPGDRQFVLAAVVVVAITAFLAVKWRRYPAALALWCVHLVVLAPTLGFTEHPHYPSDRYSYLQALVGAIALAGALAWLWERGVRLVGFAAAAAAIVIFAALSLAQIGVWRDSETLFRHMYVQLADNPYRADIAMRLGDVLRAQGRLREATWFYEESLRIQPEGSIPHVGLAIILGSYGRREEAIRHCEEALRLNPHLEHARTTLERLKSQPER